MLRLFNLGREIDLGERKPIVNVEKEVLRQAT